MPANLTVIGVNDYPDERLREDRDPRVKRFVTHYLDMEKQGVRIITKKEVLQEGVWACIEKVLSGPPSLEARLVYVSLDIDLGARSALLGCRSKDIVGLSEDIIYELAGALHQVLTRKDRLAGFDVMETDMYGAGIRLQNGSFDRTFQIEAGFIRRLITGGS